MAHWNPDVTSVSIVTWQSYCGLTSVSIETWQSYCGQEEGDRAKVVPMEPLPCTVYCVFIKMLILFLRDQDFMEEEAG